MLVDNTVFVAFALLLVLLNAFFVASEFAIVKLRSTRVDELREVHGLRGRILSVVHQRLDAYLSACQLGITLASLGLGWIGEPAFARLLDTPAQWFGLADHPRLDAVALVFAFTTISFLHIVVGELAPKSMAIRMPEAVSVWSAIPLWTFFWLMYPFIWVLNASANQMLRWVGLDDLHDQHAGYSRAELRSILHLSRPAAEGTERAVSLIVTHALELPELHVGDLMRPSQEMVGIASGATYADVHSLIRQHRFSRYPVFGSAGNVSGILHLKDIALESDGPDYFDRLVKLIHQPLLVNDQARITDVLQQFRRGATHFAIVSYADGRVDGFLTFEDILEAIFGEIYDEHEGTLTGRGRKEPRWEGDAMIAGGDTPLFRLEREIRRPIRGSDEVGTIAGLLMIELDRMPRLGDVVHYDSLRFEVLELKGRRVHWIRITSHRSDEGS